MPPGIQRNDRLAPTAWVKGMAFGHAPEGRDCTSDEFRKTNWSMLAQTCPDHPRPLMHDDACMCHTSQVQPVQHFVQTPQWASVGHVRTAKGLKNLRLWNKWLLLAPVTTNPVYLFGHGRLLDAMPKIALQVGPESSEQQKRRMALRFCCLSLCLPTLFDARTNLMIFDLPSYTLC